MVQPHQHHEDLLGMVRKKTYCSATAAFFGNAKRTADNWAVIYKADHQKNMDIPQKGHDQALGQHAGLWVLH